MLYIMSVTSRIYIASCRALDRTFSFCEVFQETAILFAPILIIRIELIVRRSCICLQLSVLISLTALQVIIRLTGTWSMHPFRVFIVHVLYPLTSALV